MIDVRTYEGDAEGLAAFTNRVWRRSYEGRMFVPLWSKEFLGRELLANGQHGRDLVVAAYEGNKLVGLHPAKPQRIRLHGREVAASWGSFLSVDPDYRRQGVAQKMQEEFVRRHRERELVADFGYLYIRNVRSLGPKFWLHQPASTRIVAKLGMWVRVLDHAAAARFELHRFESWGCRVLALVQRAPRRPPEDGGIRSYRPADFDQCRDLLHRAGESADLAYLWDDADLHCQLRWENLSRTLVSQHQGQVAGLVNYTLLDILGRHRLRTALVDALAMESLAPADRSRLLAVALHRMAADGAGVAMLLRGSWLEGADLLRAGFVPLLPEYYYIGTSMNEELPLEHVHRVHAIWR